MHQGNKLNRILQAVVALFLLITFFPLECQAQQTRIVRVGYYNNQNFQEGNAPGVRKSGYGYEYLQKVASIAGWTYVYHYGTWSNLYDEFIRGEVDVIAGLGYFQDRERYMNFPDYPMGKESYFLFVRDNDKSITSNPQTLNGKKIGTISGLLKNTLQTWLDEKLVDAEIVVFKDIKDRDSALVDGTIDVLIGESSSVASNKMKPLVKIKTVSMYLCVAKKRTDILDELNEALSKIDSDEPRYLDELSQKYFINNAVGLNVTNDEINWLAKHNNTVRIGYLNDFLPYSGTDSDKNAIGVMSDVVTEGISKLKVEQKINVEYIPYDNSDGMVSALNDGKIDAMFPVTDDVYFLEQNLMFGSTPVITSAMNLVYKDNVEDSLQKPIAVNKNNLIQDNYASVFFPGSVVYYCNTPEECINAVNNGTAGTTFLSGFRAHMLLNNSNYSQLSFIELPYSSVKSFAVSFKNSQLLSLLNRIINVNDRNEVMTYTYRYVDTSGNYSIVEFVRRHKVEFLGGLFGLISVLLLIGAYMIIKSKEAKIYYIYAYKDGLTSLLNRRAYEEELEKYKTALPDDLICVSFDLNGLKGANDNFGHAAGDELISEAGRIIKESFGLYGKIFRTGGDEYYALLRTTENGYTGAYERMQQLCSEWKGKYTDKMNISVGAAFRTDTESNQVSEMCKVADGRMYTAKAEYYRVHDKERRRT